MRLAKRLLPALIALVMVVLLLRQIDPAEVVRLLTGADGRWLLAGLGLYVLTNALRAYRFGTLFTASPGLPGSVHALRLLPEMFALSLFNNILPSRSGELSFPYFMARRHGVPVGESAAALLVVRIFDYLAVALLYVLFALLNLDRLDSQAVPMVSTVAGLLLLSLLILAAMPWLGQQILRLAQGLMERLGLVETRWTSMMLQVTRRAVAALTRMRTARTYALTFGWSLLIWLATFGWFAAFMRAIGLPQPYPLVIVGGTFAMLAKAIPLITIGGFGAHEAGWALGFTLVGLDIEAAIASGFAVNILTLAASAIFGGAALAFMRLDGRAHHTQSQRGPLGQGMPEDRVALDAAGREGDREPVPWNTAISTPEGDSG